MSGSGSDPEFNFVSSWQLDTTPEVVWDALIDFHSWPDWWSALRSVEETASGGPDGIGQRAASLWRGPLGYRIEFEIETVQRDFPVCLKGKASGGLAGSGTWHLSPVESAVSGSPGVEIWTRLVYEWQVVATKRWMKALNPVARPVFVKSHDHVMKKGADGLARYLGCRMREFATSAD